MTQELKATTTKPVANSVSKPKTEEPVVKKAPVKKVEKKPDIVWFESREKEPTMFPVAGYNPIRNFQSGRLEYRVKADDVERFERNHFVGMGRIVRKAT